MKYAPALGLLVLVLGSLAMVVMPSYLVSPVRAQTAGDIALSHTLARIATPVAVVNLVVGALLALSIWRRPESKLRSKVAVAFAVVVLAFATMNTRGYVVETMFEALPEVVRVPGYDALDVDADELVQIALLVEGCEVLQRAGLVEGDAQG